MNDRRMNNVTVGFCHNGSVRTEFMVSIIEWLINERSLNVCFVNEASGPYIPDNRNRLVREFLKANVEWMFSIDNDVAFTPEMPSLLMAKAVETGAKIIGAVYFNQIGEGKHAPWLPTWFKKAEAAECKAIVNMIPGQVLDLSTIGMGCTLIHRDVFIEMQKALPDDPWQWYGHDIIDGERAGEDVTFCSRARAAGFKVHGWCHPVTHIKTVPITWETFHHQFVKLEKMTTAAIEINDIPNIQGKNYLEIGTETGATFRHVNAGQKTGVDPAANAVVTHRMTSDEFFAQNTDKFDVVFIDGDHDAAQVVDDFNQAVRVLRPGGVIYVHDLVPPDESYAVPGRPDGAWCGDGFRMLAWAQEHGVKFEVVPNDPFGLVKFTEPHVMELADVTFAEFAERFAERFAA